MEIHSNASKDVTAIPNPYNFSDLYSSISRQNNRGDIQSFALILTVLAPPLGNKGM
jgi:hypothetical protein